MASSSTKPRLVWLTADYFADCDFDRKRFLKIVQQYDVTWIIYCPNSTPRFRHADFKGFENIPGLAVEVLHSQYRGRDPRLMLFFRNLLRKVKGLQPDLVYLNEAPENPYSLVLYNGLKHYKTILTAHDGNVKDSFRFAAVSKMIFNNVYGASRFVNLYSKVEQNKFAHRFANTKTFRIPLSLKDFGQPAATKSTAPIRFLFFGYIHDNKNLALLIEAAQRIAEMTAAPFVVSIHGYCKDWSVYQSLIRKPELFETDIRVHENSEIPDLFAGSHYAVFPYKDVSQSGALKVAFNYDLPVIVSDLPAFTEDVQHGENGFVFKNGDIDALTNLLKRIIEQHDQQYESIVARLRGVNRSKYSHEVVSDRYLNMFKEVISA